MVAAIPLDLVDDPILRALDNAPIVQRLTTEERAELDQAMSDIAAGRVKLVPHAEVHRTLEEMRREQGE